MLLCSRLNNYYYQDGILAVFIHSFHAALISMMNSTGFALISDVHENRMLAENTLRLLCKFLQPRIKNMSQGTEVRGLKPILTIVSVSR